MEKGQKKKGGCLKVVLIVIGIFLVLGIIGSLFGESDKKAKSDSNNKTTNLSVKDATKEEPKVAEEHYEVDLSAGNYVAGKDIPSGTYNITATAGSGNVSSSNMYSGGLNEVMGSPVDEYTTDSFNGLKMDDGVTLSVGGTVKLHLISENAKVSGVTARTVADATPIDLGAGNYTAGADFPAGTFNVVATGGNGNVSSDNMYDGGLNEILGTTNDGFSITQYNNAIFNDGTVLTISGTTVQLVPVGE